MHEHGEKTVKSGPRILVATGLYPPEIGGPATYTVFLEKHLPQCGIGITVVPFTRVRTYPKLIRHLVYLVLLLRAGRSCDIVYALDTVSVGIPACIASRVLRKRFLLRVPGDYAWEQGQQRFGVTDTLDTYLVAKKKPLPVRVLAWLQRQVANRAARIIVPSDYMRGVVGVWGIDARKVTRIYSALKVITVAEHKEALRVQLSMDGFVVTTAARLTPWKGVRALIDAVAILRPQGVPASLFFFGDGPERASLEEHARAVGGRDCTLFLGTRTRDELAQYVKASDAFVLNTSYEGLSHQLLEVMHIGTPIVTTPVGGNVELITNEVEGLLVPFNGVTEMTAALARLHEDAQLRESLVKNATARVQAFHEDAVITEFVTCVRTL